VVPFERVLLWIREMDAGHPEKVRDDLSRLVSDARARGARLPAPTTDPPSSAGPEISTR
jgi:hypothetical protein